MPRSGEPLSYDPDLRRDTPLALKLKARIWSEGPITVSDYMRACLHDPELGYYATRPAIGTDGDFVTAPEISQTFGELIGLWAAVAWQQMGAPVSFTLLELGPGRGTLMSDALRATRGVPGFHDALRLVLLESNARLITEQRARLASCSPAWIDRLDALPAGPVIAIANEFLDTCPVEQTDGAGVRTVGLDTAGHLSFDAGVEVDPAVVETQDFEILRPLFQAGNRPFAALFIDYGHITRETGETLQALRAHRTEHPLTSPGEADLTVQVCFADFAAYVVDCSGATLEIDGPVTQSEFLGRLGLIERTSRLMSANPAKAHEIEAGVARLIAPTGMGSRFKVVGVRSSIFPPLPGF